MNYLSEKNELERLEEIQKLGLSNNNLKYNKIVDLVKVIFNVPIVLVTIVEKDLQWFASCIGVSINSTPRSQSFCTYTIKNDDIMEIPDARKDKRFKENPLVIGDPHIVFYAGKPIYSNGHRIGTLCIIDTIPRKLTEKQRNILEVMAEYITTDIKLNTTIKETQKQNKVLSKNLEFKNKMMAMIHHDIVNCLSPSISLLNIINDQDGKIKMIFESTIKAYEYAKDIVDIFKMDLDKFVIEKKSIKIKNIINKVIKNKRIEFGHKTYYNLHVACDKMKIVRVLDNLINNSLDFIDPKTGKVIINIDRDPENIIFSVTDNGVGIPENKIDSLFGLFNKNINVKKGRYSTGIGLYACKKIIEAHNGTIYYDINYKKGTRFVFKLPFTQMPK